MKSFSVLLAAGLSAVIITSVGADTVDVTTLSAGKKVVSRIDTQTLEAETTTVLRKAGAVWIEDEAETEDAREKLADEQASDEDPQQSVINDCDGNGTDDAADISAGAIDFDWDGRLDKCEYAYGDLNLNGIINQQDVNILLGWWGIPNPQYGDLNNDNSCGPSDLGVLLARWGFVP